MLRWLTSGFRRETIRSPQVHRQPRFRSILVVAYHHRAVLAEREPCDGRGGVEVRVRNLCEQDSFLTARRRTTPTVVSRRVSLRESEVGVP